MSAADSLRILHAYKTYRPDTEGGIPAVMSSLAHAPDLNASHSILTARRFGFGRRFELEGVPVEAVTSFGNLFSSPLAPSYMPMFVRRARTADIVIHHAPFPFNDLAILL